MKYSFEDILEMLGGYRYYSREQLLYVFHQVNGHVEEAQQYYEILQEENKKIEEACNKLKTETEIKQLSNDNT
jgi:cell division protein FtsB